MQKRILITTFTFLFILTFKLTYSQSNILQQKISLIGKNITIQEALEKIENKTGYTFSYNSDIINKFRKISINAKDKIVSDVLHQILGSDYNFKVFNRQILIYTYHQETNTKVVIKEETQIKKKVVYDTVKVKQIAYDTIRVNKFDTIPRYDTIKVVINDTVKIFKTENSITKKNQRKTSIDFEITPSHNSQWKSPLTQSEDKTVQLSGYNASIMINHISSNHFIFGTGVEIGKQYYENSIQGKININDTVYFPEKEIYHFQDSVSFSKINSFTTIGIPLQAGYIIKAGKFAFVPTINMNFSIITSSKIYAFETQKDKLPVVTKITDINKFLFSTHAGIKFKYFIGQETSIFIKPNIQYLINSIYPSRYENLNGNIRFSFAFGASFAL